MKRKQPRASNVSAPRCAAGHWRRIRCARLAEGSVPHGAEVRPVLNPALLRNRLGCTRMSSALTGRRAVAFDKLVDLHQESVEFNLLALLNGATARAEVAIYFLAILIQELHLPKARDHEESLCPPLVLLGLLLGVENLVRLRHDAFASYATQCKFVAPPQQL